MCIHSHIACPQAKEAQQHSTHTLHSYMCTFANCHQHVAGIGTQTRVYICVSYMHRLQLARCWHHTHIRVYILQIAITALLIFYIYVCIHLHSANTQAKRAHRKATCHLRYTKWTYMSTYVSIQSLYQWIPMNIPVNVFCISNIQSQVYQVTIHICQQMSIYYRVAKTHRMPYFHWSCSAKEPHN